MCGPRDFLLGGEGGTAKVSGKSPPSLSHHVFFSLISLAVTTSAWCLRQGIKKKNDWVKCGWID